MTEINFDAIFEDLPDRTLLRVGEVAKFMGVSIRTVYAWYPDLLSGTNVKGVTRIYRQSVIDLVIKNNGKKRSDELPEEIEKKLNGKKKERVPLKRGPGWVDDWKL